MYKQIFIPTQIKQTSGNLNHLPVSSNSTAVPKLNAELNASGEQVKQARGHGSPQRPMHECPQSSFFEQGLSHGVRLQGSPQVFMHDECSHLEVHGS